MRVLISTSLLTLFAISAFAGVMPEDIHATSNQISETIEVVQGTEVIKSVSQPTFKEHLDGLIQFAFHRQRTLLCCHV